MSTILPLWEQNGLYTHPEKWFTWYLDNRFLMTTAGLCRRIESTWLWATIQVQRVRTEEQSGWWLKAKVRSCSNSVAVGCTEQVNGCEESSNLHTTHIKQSLDVPKSVREKITFLLSPWSMGNPPATTSSKIQQSSLSQHRSTANISSNKGWGLESTSLSCIRILACLILGRQPQLLSSWMYSYVMWSLLDHVRLIIWLALNSRPTCFSCSRVRTTGFVSLPLDLIPFCKWGQTHYSPFQTPSTNFTQAGA